MISIKDLFQIIIIAIPFILLVIGTSKINLKKSQRGHQFAMIILAIIYSIISMFKFEQFCDKFLAFIKSLIALMTTLSQKYPEYESVFLRVANAIDSVDWAKFIIPIANALLFLLFLIIKRVMLPVFKKIWDNEGIYSATSGIAYEFKESVSAYCLKDNYFLVKKLSKVYYYVLTVLMVFLIVASNRHSDLPAFKAIMYPYIVIIIMGELFFFLDGLTAAEYRNAYSGDDGNSETVALYYPFKHYLSLLFGDRLIDAKTRFPGYRHNNIDILKKYEEMDTQEGRLVNLFFYKKVTRRKKIETENLDDNTQKVTSNDKNIKGIQLDESVVDATFKLMNGESVLFSTPFYKDYSDYIFLPINRSLTKGNKALFIVGRNGIEDDIIEWISDSLESTSNVPELWAIGKLSDAKDYDGDVAVMNAADVFNEKIIENNRNFINSVTEVILIEPSQFISTAQLSISTYVANVAENATYYIFDRNLDGLVDTLSHVIKKSIVSVTPTNRERNINTYMLWRAEGENLSHKLFPSVARYLGMGTELMIAAIKEQVSVAQWYAYNMFPVDEMKWITHQYYPVLCEYAALPAEEEELEARMKFSHNMWGAEKSDYKYVVVEDEFCNLYEMARQFQNRGCKETFVNIISPNYLLRDYMEFNTGLFVNDPKAIPSFSPDFVRTDRNIALELLLNMFAKPMKEQDVVNVLRNVGNEIFFGDYTSYDVKNAIFELINRYIPNQKRSIESVIEEREKYYRIKKSHNNEYDDSIKKILSELKSVYYVLENDEPNENYLDSKLYGQVFQSHLPGQHITIGGKYYEIVVVGGDKGVILKRAGDHITCREYYRQFRTYSINGFELEKKIGSSYSIGDIEVSRGQADFDVETTGYLMMKNYGDVENDCYRVDLNDIPKRHYKNKTVLRLLMPYISENEKATIVLVLNEIFKTTYSENSNYICAVTDVSGFDDTDGLLYDFVDNSDSENKYIYIIEDSVLDMGLIKSVERNLKRFLEIITDYLNWYRHMLQPVVVTTGVDEDVVTLDNSEIDEILKTREKETLIDKIKSLFSRRKKRRKKDDKEEKDDAEGEETVTEIDDPNQDDASNVNNEADSVENVDSNDEDNDAQPQQDEEQQNSEDEQEQSDSDDDIETAEKFPTQNQDDEVTDDEIRNEQKDNAVNEEENGGDGDE